MNTQESQTEALSPSSATVLILPILVALACLVRIVVAFAIKATWYNTDTYMYLDMANAILAGKPMSTAPSGYPLIIVIVKSIAGARLLPAALIGLNVLLSTCAVLLCYGIGAAVGSQRAGLIAAALMTVWPSQINYMRQILTETPSTFFLLLGFWLIVKERHVSGGASIYIAALIRSALLPVTVLVLFWIIAFRKTKAGAAHYAAGLLVIFLMNFALVKLHLIEPPANAGEDLLIAIQAEGADGINFKTDTYPPEQKAHPLHTYFSFWLPLPAHSSGSGPTPCGNFGDRGPSLVIRTRRDPRFPGSSSGCGFPLSAWLSLNYAADGGRPITG